MGNQMAVVGDDGEIVGYINGDDIDGDDGVDGEVMGLRRSRGRMMRIPRKPQWRRQLAPGVIQPDEGMVPLPLSALTNGGVFTATVTQIIFQGQLQKPFRGERLLVSTVRTGASSTGRLLGQIFNGTDLQQADINAFDLELVGQATAFGTRLTTKAAEPGVLNRIICTLSAGLTGTDTVQANMFWLGRIIH
jgi:hypothetical protein